MVKMILWLNVSLSVNLSKKKKLKLEIHDDDYNRALEDLHGQVRSKILLPLFSDSSSELPELELVYKAETDLQGGETNLDEGDDLEGMLDEFLDGKIVRARVIVKTDDFEGRSFFAGATMMSEDTTMKVSHYLDHQYNDPGAVAIDSIRSSRTSSPMSQPRKRQKSSLSPQNVSSHGPRIPKEDKIHREVSKEDISEEYLISPSDILPDSSGDSSFALVECERQSGTPCQSVVRIDDSIEVLGSSITDRGSAEYSQPCQSTELTEDPTLNPALRPFNPLETEFLSSNESAMSHPRKRQKSYPPHQQSRHGPRTPYQSYDRTEDNTEILGLYMSDRGGVEYSESHQIAVDPTLNSALEPFNRTVTEVLSSYDSESNVSLQKIGPFLQTDDDDTVKDESHTDTVVVESELDNVEVSMLPKKDSVEVKPGQEDQPAINEDKSTIVEANIFSTGSEKAEEGVKTEPSTKTADHGNDAEKTADQGSNEEKTADQKTNEEKTVDQGNSEDRVNKRQTTDEAAHTITHTGVETKIVTTDPEEEHTEDQTDEKAPKIGQKAQKTADRGNNANKRQKTGDTSSPGIEIDGPDHGESAGSLVDPSIRSEIGSQSDTSPTIPSVVQADALYSSETITAPDSASTSDPLTVKREISAEEKDRMVDVYLESRSLAISAEGPEETDQKYINNTTYNPSPRVSSSHVMSYSQILRGPPTKHQEKTGFMAGLTGGLTEAWEKIGEKVFTNKIVVKKISVSFIMHAKEKGSFSVHYAIGGPYSKWSRTDCQEMISYPTGTVYRCVIEDVPENTRIFYKFFKYHVSYVYNQPLNIDWEYLDKDLFWTDRNHHSNRVLDVHHESKTVYIAIKLSYAVTNFAYFKQYSTLLTVILTQNHSLVDMCSQLDNFVINTLLDPSVEAKKAFKEHFDTLIGTYFRKGELRTRLLLVWILPHFSRRNKGQQKKDTLSISQVKECSKLLLPLAEDDIESSLRLTIAEKVVRLVSIHREDSPLLIILLFLLYSKVQKTFNADNDEDVLFMVDNRHFDHFDSLRLDVTLGKEFFVDNKSYIERTPGLMEFGARNTDLAGMAYLVQMYPRRIPIKLVLDCVRNWNLDELANSTMKMKDINAATKEVCRYVLSNLERENITKPLEQILQNLGRALHDYDVRRTYHQRETRSYTPWGGGGSQKDENWFKMASGLFVSIWHCYIVSAIKWKQDIIDIHSKILYSQEISWWTKMFNAINATEPLTMTDDDKNYRAVAEEFFLEQFKYCMSAKDYEEKKKIVQVDDFLDERVVPQKMINIMIDTMQSFIVKYLKENQRFYSTNRGFVKALQEILLRKFPGGVTHKHLLVSNPDAQDYFPWEEMFEFSSFKDNDYVKDARMLLKETFEKIVGREVRLNLLTSLVDENNQFNGRFCFLVSNVVKAPVEETKKVFSDVAGEYEEFQMILRNCQLLIDAFGNNKGEQFRDRIPQLKDFEGMKIKDVWDRITAPKRVFKVLPRCCFKDLHEEQIRNLRYIKLIQACKLYENLITRQFNDIATEECDMDNLLRDLVIKAFEPAFSKLREVIEKIKSEGILQSTIKEKFGPNVPGYNTYADVRKDLLHVCHALEDVVGPRISDRTFQKLEIILSDLTSAFDCLDSIKATLNITTTWKNVEKLRKTVCKTKFDEALSAIDASLDLAFFYKIRDTRELVSGFAQSQELINWIKEIAKDEKDITTFIDLATTLEDAATSDRLSGLHKIMMAIRPLIFDVRSDGKFADFQKAFEKMYDYVKGDDQITSRLKDVTENLKWFKETQDLQTDTTKSSISQVENIRLFGEFIVGCSKERTNLSDFFEERKIDDLLRSDIVFQSGSTKVMRYKDLKELNDKLVLISGQQNYHDKVNVFTQVFGKLTQICEAYKELNECGHANYQKWELHYNFKDPAKTLADVTRKYKEMRSQLEEENEEIEKNIRLHKSLTNFTRLQLLYLRNKLSSFKDDQPPSYYHETLILLHAINPQIAIEDVRREIYRLDCKSDMLTIDELGKLLGALHVKLEGDTSSLTKYLKQGMITLLKVVNRDIFRCVLSLFMHANRAPSAEEVLCCTPETNEQQVSMFLRRAIFANDFRQINCLVSPEKLSYQLNKHFVEEYERLSKNSIHKTLTFFLVVITVENVPSEIASTYVSSLKQFPLQGNANKVKEFTTQTILRNERCTCDPDKLSGRLVQSEGSGNGKTRKAQLILNNHDQQYLLRCIPIHKRVCDRNMIVKEFLSYEKSPLKRTVYLVDVSPSVREGADVFIFELLILRKITDSAGRVFRPFSGDYILIEGLFSSGSFIRNFPTDFTSYLPVYDCLSPRQSLDIYRTGQQTQDNQILLEEHQFRTQKWQRVYQYLYHYREHNESMDGFQFSCNNYLEGRDHEQHCIETFLQYVNIEDPSWRELDNFVCFLNTQLMCYERSAFTNSILAPELGVQFNAFVVKFMIKMSEEFATRSLNISEGADVLDNHKLQKLWDKTFHPYLFFNNDGMSFTFVGFKIQAPGDLVDVVTDEVKIANFMNQDLLGRLRGQRVTFKENYNAYTPELLMEKLTTVLDLKIERIQVADDYKLTLDNTIKILAIHMRMRSNIPVVIMGETGCGKTRLISFMCDIVKQSMLSRFDENDIPDDVENLITLRVHGGVTSAKIGETIAYAEQQASRNMEIDNKFETIVFFDEANATSEIDLIREIMCNHTINGRPINSSIRFIAAVNPYRKHTQAMIELLKKAGLGYRTGDAEVFDRIGDIPLRELVYRVQPLPPSLKPLIWDFGAMDNNTEKQYIKLIIKSRLAGDSINESYMAGLVDIISGCQDILRQRSDQCSFVSLRDVNRFIEVFKWFQRMTPIFADLAREQAERDGKRDIFNPREFPLVVLSTINAIGVCYYVRISARDEYLQNVAQYFRDPFPGVTGRELRNMIEDTQHILLYEMLHNSGVRFQEDVAENEALRENIFMMVVCIELNIPLFIVGHPGSSKSLAKLIVKACMSGLSSNSKLFDHLCQIHMTSFQCSPQSEAEGIERTFASAEKFISDGTHNQNRRVMPVVVLDEIGLAEDSKKMPLKALHSLLENNGMSDRTKIGFIGISNWALDPAKMNRGLYVTRQVPDKNELKVTAIQICKPRMRDKLKRQLEAVADVYMDIYDQFSRTDTKSYIGLRDFYCLVKHLCRRAEDKGSSLSPGDILNTVYRNFGGICPDANTMVLEAFSKRFPVINELKPNTLDMIRENLRAETLTGGSRYLLIVTPTLETTIDTIDQELKNCYRHQKLEGRTPQIKFNSDFPDDADYTKRCKIINDVKNSIERGDDILLIDMEMIYESLYDVLNQYYKEWQGNKYVEIALESHRVNCRVHDRTKIILLARPEQAVKFPIPLLNRMEKHYFTLKESMSVTENYVVAQLEDWAQNLTTSTTSDHLKNYDTNETFIGYHGDTAASIVKTEWKRIQTKRGETRDLHQVTAYTRPLLDECKLKLLRTVSYDGLVRFSLSNNDKFTEEWEKYYARDGKVWPMIKDLNSFIEYLKTLRVSTNHVVTTYSHLPAKKNLPLPTDEPGYTFNVEEFGSQGTFESGVQPYFQDGAKWLVILVPQRWHKLLSYMRFYLQSSLGTDMTAEKHVIIITQLIRNSEDRPALFHSDVWDNIHIEDLNRKSIANRSVTVMSDLTHVWHRDIPKLFHDQILEIMDVLGACKEQVVCNISNPFPHADIGAMLQDCLTSGYLQGRITHALEESQKQPAGDKLNWIQRAALDRARLSENTSFQNVLMQKVSESLTSVAASIMSDIDRDGNAALRALPHLTDFWEDMLNVMPASCWTSVEAQTSEHGSVYQIQHNFNLWEVRHVPCQFPFSWLIKEKLDEMSPGVFTLTNDGVANLVPDFEDMADCFLNELITTSNGQLYDVLSKASVNADLRCDLNRRYLSDYLNMVYESNSDLESQIAHQIFEVKLPKGWEEKPVAECAILIQIYHLRQRGEIQLEALHKALTVYTQEINRDIICFEEAAQSEEPLFTLCNILLSQIEDSLENIMKTNNFTVPLKLLVNLQRGDRFDVLMSGWERTRFKKLNSEFIKRLTVLRIPEPLTHAYYNQIQQVLEQDSIQESIGEIVERLYQMITSAVHELALDQNMLQRMWVCSHQNCQTRSLIFDQVITPCRHVFCRDCFNNLKAQQNFQCPTCREPLFEDMPSIPEDLTLLKEVVTGSSGEAVSFLSQVIVTFLTEQRLQPDALATLTTLGKGRIPENNLLKSVPPDKLDALQTLIFTMFVKNQITTRDIRYADCISEACHVTNQINVKTLAKFVSITKDVQLNPRLWDVPGLIGEYVQLFDDDASEDVEYIQATIQSVSGLRAMLEMLLGDVLKVIDDHTLPLSQGLIQLRDNLFPLNPRHVYTLKLFFLKQIFQQRGTSVLPKVMKNDELKWISPIEDPETEDSDLFTLLGTAYTKLRNALATSAGNNSVEEVGQVLEECLPLHAVAATYYVLGNNQIPNNIKELVCGTLVGAQARQCFTALCSEHVDHNVVSGVDLTRVGDFRSPITLLYLILQIQCKHPFIRLLENIRMYPEQTENKFLPGMRDNSLAEFIGSLGEGSNKYKWYRCGNGHAYAINNCGRPMQVGRCACGSEIGGENHKFVNAANTAEITNANITNLGFDEKGYNLLPPTVRILTDTERRLPPLLLNIVRWFIHAAFLLSETADQYQDRIFKLGNANIGQFLVQNMSRDLEGMRQHLQTGPDACIMFLVKVMISFTLSPDNGHFSCTNKRDRQMVEDSIVCSVQPLLENPGSVIREAQVLIVNDLNMATDPLIKQLYEFEDPPANLSSAEYHCSVELWRNSQPLNLDLFCNTFSNTLKSEDQAQYPTVKIFVEIRRQIHLLGLLPKIIEFHRRLLSRYSYKMSLEEARKTTIGQVIRGDTVLTEGFLAWRQAWEELGLATTRFAVPETYKDKTDIRHDEPLSLFLPEPVAREGICCLHLIDGLISLHNKLVHHTRRKEVKLCDRFLSVNYNPERTSMFLLYSHSLQLVGKHREVRFSYPVFERYLMDEVIGGVHPISDAMSQFENDNIKMMYREDITWLELCNKLSKREQQERIPATIKLDFNDIRTATEAKKALATAIGLIRGGLGSGSSHESLVAFMERIGCSKENSSFSIPDSLKKCHVLDAWYTAYFYKSLHSTHNPFSDLGVVTTLPPDAAEWFHRQNQKLIKIWLIEFHRFLVDWTVLKPPGEEASFEGWNLPEAYDFYLERALLARPDEETPALPELPDLLSFEHSVAFWLNLKETYQTV